MARFRLELGPVPLHHQVYLDLKAALDRARSRRATGCRPSASCAALRLQPDHDPAALSELAREGRIERTRGRGTFALKPRIDRDFADTLSFTEEMQRRGLDPETRLVAARPGRRRGRRRGALNLEVGDRVPRAPPVVDGEPLLLEQVHLPAERFPGLLASDLEHNSCTTC